MAGRGRGAEDGEKTTAGVSERLLFADTVPAEAVPVWVPVPRPATEISDGDAVVKPPPPAAIDLIRRRFRRASFSVFRRGVAEAASTELDRGIGFLLVPVFLAAGVILYYSVSAEPDLYRPLAAVALMALCAAVSRPWLKTHLVFMAALFCALGFVAAKVETWRAATPMLGSEIQTRLTGRVVIAEEMANGRVRLTIDLVSTAHPKLRYAPDRVRVSARRIPAGMKAGSLVTGYARLLPPTGRPESYDFSFDSYFSGIGGSGFFLGDPKLIPPTDPIGQTSIASAIENARENIADHIRSTVGGPEGEIAAALIVGVRAGIPEDINEAMRRTGIYHIISISGLHMALVAGTVMLLLRGAFALFPDFSSRRPVKKYAAAIALMSIAAYLVISGVVVAAERSFIMLAVMLIAVLFDRAALTMR
ncbi:MAG: ComEC family DNA internalization-related competence protein, partial [Mesorhizobium sp.]